MFGCNYNQLLALAQVLLPLLLRPSARTSKKDNVKVQHIGEHPAVQNSYNGYVNIIFTPLLLI